MPRSYSILLLDDDPFILQVYAEHLEEAGHLVTPARTGRGCCELFEENPDFDLVLIDYAMPDMMGDQVLKRLRAIQPAVRAAFLSGYGEFLELSGKGEQCPVIEKSPKIAETIVAIEAVAAGTHLPSAFDTAESRLEGVVRRIATKPGIEGIGQQIQTSNEAAVKEDLPASFSSLLQRLRQRAG